MDLSFLSNVQLEVVETKVSAPRVSTPKLPEDGIADIRIFKNGRVYPSKAYASANDLEFVARVEVEGKTITTGNGVDIFSSDNWGMLAGKLPEEVIFIAAVPKSYPKVDMWNSTKFDKETGEPTASVFTQGANSFSKNHLVPMLAKAYGINWETTEYVDLKVEEMSIPSVNGVYNIPKIIAAGQHKGEATYIRRENLNIHPLVVVEVKEIAVKAVKATSGVFDATEEVDTPIEGVAVDIDPVKEDLNKESTESNWADALNG